MAVEGFASIGEAASQFAQGFMQARMAKAQRAMQDHQQRLEDIKTLSDNIDRFKDAPEVQATMISHLNEMLGTLPKPPKPGDEQTGGIVNFFKNTFGRKNPQAPKGTDPMSLMPEADSESTGSTPPTLPAVPALQPDSAGSQTFGNVNHMFGREVAQPGAGTPAPAATAPTAAPTALGPMAQPAAPVAAAPVTNEFLPRPDQLSQEAIAKSMVKIPGVAVGGVRNKEAETRYIQDRAGQHTDAALKAITSILQANPDIRTERQMYDSPHGDDYSHVLNRVEQYEAAGMVPKGTMEAFRRRFADVQFGAEKYDSRAVKDGYQHDPVTDKFTTPVSDEAKLTDAYSTPADKRTPEQLNRIAGHLEAMKNKAKNDPSSLTQDERARTAYYDSLVAQGLTEPKLFTTYQANAHPMPPAMSTTTGISPTTGKSVIMVLDHHTGKVTPTEIRSPGAPFISTRYQDKIPGPPVKGPTGKDMPGPPVDAFNADRLIAAHTAGDPSVSLDTLTDILKSGAAMTDPDRKKLSDYINRQTAPTF